MKNVTLMRISLENFKGRSMSLDFSGNAVIKGTNEAGKSTLTNAFFWLLTGVDAQDRTNYKLYDATKEFTQENAVPAVVEGVFDIDGTVYKFKKTAKQKWYRPRGKAEYVKDKSDEYQFYIDDLAVSANVYKERIEALFAPIDKLKLMLNVRYYQTLDWKKLRKHFSDMVGVIAKSELKGNYSSIEPLLAKYENDETFKGNAVDAVKEKLRQEIKPLNDSRNEIEAEIKGMYAILPSLDGVDEAEALITKKKERIEEIETSILGLSDANKPYIEKRKAHEELIYQKETELRLARSDWDKQEDAPINAIKSMIANIDKANAVIRAENERLALNRKNIEQQLEMACQQQTFLEEELERLRAENNQIKARNFDDSLICEHCGQPLPYDKVEALKEAFYQQKEADHEGCVKRGLKMRDKLNEQNKLRASLETSLASQPALKQVQSDEALQIELQEALAARKPFEDSNLYSVLHHQIELLKSQVPSVPTTDATELLVEKRQLHDEISELANVTNRRSERQRGEKVIEQKKGQLAAIGVTLASLEGLLAKCIEREREWASIVRDRANKYLKFSHVEMLELNKSGELNDVCILTAKNVPSDTQNNATQILIGIDLAQAFQANANVRMPLFIDNAEGIVEKNLPSVDSQLITLYVDEAYPQLMVMS